MGIQGKQGLGYGLGAHQVDELGEDDFHPIGRAGEEIGQHVAGDAHRFLGVWHLLQAGKRGPNGVELGAVLEVRDRLTTNQHQIDGVALGLELGVADFRALDDVRVVATAQTPIAGHGQQGDGGNVPLLQ